MPAMKRGGGKSFGDAANERIREGLKELLRRYNDNQTRLAEKLGISQPAVSAIRAGGNAGPATAQAIARELGLSLDQLTTGEKGDEAFVRWRVLDWWEGVLSKAREHAPTVSPGAWDWLGSLAGTPPPEDPHALALMARAWEDAQARAHLAKKASKGAAPEAPEAKPRKKRDAA